MRVGILYLSASVLAAALVVYLIEQSHGTIGQHALLLVAGGTALALFVTALLLERRPLARLKRARRGQSLEDFRGDFPGGSIPEQVLIELYRYLQESIVSPRDFPVRATDEIVRTLGIRDEDYVELFHDLIRRCRCQIPLEDAPEKVPAQDKATVRDVAHFLAQLDPRA